MVIIGTLSQCPPVYSDFLSIAVAISLINASKRVFNSSTWCSGDSIKKFDYQYHLPNLEKNSQQRNDIERFRWFSQDYLGFIKEENLA